MSAPAGVAATQQDLDRWAAASERACAECEQAEIDLLAGGREQALEHVTRARETAWTTYRAIVAAGGREAHEGDGAGARALPLRLLDTPAVRELLRAVEDAAAAAGDVDRERGWTLKDGTPAGFAETLGDLALRLRVEVFGPQGRGAG